MMRIPRSQSLLSTRRDAILKGFSEPDRPQAEVLLQTLEEQLQTLATTAETQQRDPFLAARFANIVASMSVEAPGMDAIPMRADVERWVEAESLAGKA